MNYGLAVTLFARTEVCSRTLSLSLFVQHSNQFWNQKKKFLLLLFPDASSMLVVVVVVVVGQRNDQIGLELPSFSAFFGIERTEFIIYDFFSVVLVGPCWSGCVSVYIFQNNNHSPALVSGWSGLYSFGTQASTPSYYSCLVALGNGVCQMNFISSQCVFEE